LKILGCDTACAWLLAGGGNVCVVAGGGDDGPWREEGGGGDVPWREERGGGEGARLLVDLYNYTMDEIVIVDPPSGEKLIIQEQDNIP
jgi:hypothetical protein